MKGQRGRDHFMIIARRESQGAPQPSPSGAGGSHEVHVGRDKPASGSDDLRSKDVVAFSSRLIAAARAIESRREDRLFKDAFAERLVRGYGKSG